MSNQSEPKLDNAPICRIWAEGKRVDENWFQWRRTASHWFILVYTGHTSHSAHMVSSVFVCALFILKIYNALQFCGRLVATCLHQRSQFYLINIFFPIPFVASAHTQHTRFTASIQRGHKNVTLLVLLGSRLPISHITLILLQKYL